MKEKVKTQITHESTTKTKLQKEASNSVYLPSEASFTKGIKIKTFPLRFAIFFEVAKTLFPSSSVYNNFFKEEDVELAIYARSFYRGDSIYNCLYK